MLIMSKIYLAGPMTFRADSDFNYPAFNEAAARLRKLGFEVFNPAETDGGSTYKAKSFYMRRAIAGLCECDSMVVLPGWEHSRGTLLEIEIATALNMPVRKLEDIPHD